ncbi:aminopeptidase [Actinomyces radicidentis]|uniref:Aminopeptidase n=1 Tax=Actinomyces radicidentis TaxID=111015 RepID=A0A0X8JEY8_ACTRD|nr:alpha/beta fold hydrolase [Actinomyces radicidentis]AMD87593.1 aminopeptidase [Actinomyces radicidentis]
MSTAPRLVSGPWSAATAGLLTRDHRVAVPFDRSGAGDRFPDGSAVGSETITVYAREVVRLCDADGAPEDGPAPDRPWLVFLQGGPGCESPRPSADGGAGWLGAVLEHYRVLLLDQRGTGASTPVDRADLGGDAAGTARLLIHLRADEIVEDCEDLRRALGVDRWSLLGQSFGGFCVTRYLSAHAGSLETVYLTGGLPAVGHSVDEAYALTYEAMRLKSEDFYSRYPADRDRVAALMEAAARGEVRTAAGDVVGPTRLRGLGSTLGASGGIDALHHLLERDPASWAFRYDLGAMLPFGGRNPLYAVIHESCWADGGATPWAAERVRPTAFDNDPTLLTGEHVTRDSFAEDSTLRPWREVAEILAEHEWPRLYDEAALRVANVPGAAAVYARDVYVPMTTSLETASLMPRLRTWVTSEYEHNGSSASGGAVFRRLRHLAAGALIR